MRQQPARGLVDLRRDAVDDLATKLLDPTTANDELKRAQERIGFFDAALSAQSVKLPRKLKVAVLCLAISSAVLLGLALTPVGHAPFVLTAESLTISAVTREPTMLTLVALRGEVTVEGADEISGARIEANTDSASKGATGRFVADKVFLREVQIPAHAVVDLDATPNAASLSITTLSGSIAGTVDLVTPTFIGVGRRAQGSRDPDAVSLADRELLRFRSSPDAAPSGPATVRITSNRLEGWPIVNEVWPQSLRFLQRRSSTDSAPKYVSSLLKGTVVLPWTGATVQIERGDVLEIDDIDVGRFEMKVDDLVQVQVNGSAKRIGLRTGAAEKSLKPSLLEFLTRNHGVAMLWSSAVFIWGLLWSSFKLLDA